MKILFIGDIFGSPGRAMLEHHLKRIVQQYSIDFVIANAENSAHGKGITSSIYEQLIRCGVNVITMGNHTWAKPEIEEILGRPNIIRPINLKEEYKYSEFGVGTIEVECKGLKIRVSNFLGQSVFFKQMQKNAFINMRSLLNEIDKPDIHIVDLHAETTAEKYAFLWAFNGEVEAILGTHTHVPTNDACITEEGTVFVCDVGMTGPSHGIIGAKRDDIIRRFFNPEVKFLLEVQKGPRQMSCVILEYDEINKKMIEVSPLIIREGFKYLGKTVLETI